jgi:thiopurine S-methyltransferase
VDEAFWKNRWQTGQIGFHEGATNRFLERYADRFLPPPGKGRVLVPMCGKSADLAFLAARGHDVLGCEIVAQAAEDFFHERSMRIHEEAKGSLLYLSSERVTIVVGDVMSLEPSVVGRFEALYDRAALIALPPDARPLYGSRMAALLEPGGKGLVIGLTHDAGQGPPFDVPEQDVRAAYTDLTIALLEVEDVTATTENLTKKGATRVVEAAYLVAAR